MIDKVCNISFYNIKYKEVLDGNLFNYEGVKKIPDNR